MDNGLHELTFLTTAEGSLLAEELLQGLGALSVSLEDAHAEGPDEQALFMEPGMVPVERWDRSLVSALFSAPLDVAEVEHSLRSWLPDPEELSFSWKHFHDADWVQCVQDQFGAAQVGRRLWVVPSWSTAPTDPDAIVLRLDPGAAFGTGSHATTRLCLRWIEEVAAPGKSCLDMGCGSGILAIAAARYGCCPVYGVDLDPTAVQVAAHNAEENGCTARFWVTGEQPLPTVDLLVANILSSPLIGLAPELTSCLQEGSQIALSGILEGQAEAVQEAYHQASGGRLVLRIQAIEEEWVLLTGQMS